MKLIHFIKGDTLMHVNPRYVRFVKGVRSEYTNDYCIVLDMDDNNKNSIITLSFTKEEEYVAKMNEIIKCMES